MDWQRYEAAIFRARKENLKPVEEIDEIYFKDLLGLDKQKEALYQNTLNFIEGKEAHHSLLWGAKGCGKSSLVRAVFCELKDKNLRLVELCKDDLSFLVDLIDELRKESYNFIIFCDDLSFEENDNSYKFLKPLLDGSIEKIPSNILFYASSNRRHLLKEKQSDNDDVSFSNADLHLGDSIDEKLSLSDRFGLWISFYQGNFDEYLNIVDFYFKDFKGDKKELHAKAKEFSMLRASRSARTAKQFYISFKDVLK
ncbi:MAG TPA: ATP-binding protein [Campylobacter avium]|uniref:ATP-binding protein n=1 Tax=Campylobacter avium TaxID=522485 RepID=UPI001DDB8EFD|nr:ATP-binding protein [Campylobacter avium]HJE66864.1 ATP-binding protein [Campylobacter avium]